MKGNHARGLQHGKQQSKKKRDISTAFRKGPVPRPLVNTTQQPAQEEEPLIGIPPPASLGLEQETSTFTGPNLPAYEVLMSQAEAITGFSLGEACRTNRGFSEPVIAAAAVTASVMPAQDLSMAFGGPSILSTDSDTDAMLWADADPLASFDRVLDGLLVAPPLPPAFTSTDKPTSSKKRASGSNSSILSPSSLLSSSSLLVPTNTAAPAAPSSTSNRRASSSSGSASKKPVKKASNKPVGWHSRSFGVQSLAGAAAGPAVSVIHCETEFERELEAAAALKQLLVLKVESSQHLVSRAQDPSLRFQTHNNLPTQLNTYLMQHSDLPGLSSPASSSSSTSSGSSSTADVLASMGVPLGMPASSNITGGISNPSGALGAGNSTEPFSPVHAWYKQLAAKYAHSAADAGCVSPVRFLSLQSDSARARSVCRRLGVSAPLAVVLLDAASGRKLQEVCGAKIETELPNGLLYFGGSDPQGVRSTELLQQINTQAELEAVKSASPLSVVAFHVHGAPPCVRSYGRMHSVAQQYASTTSSSSSAPVSFAVMDVDLAKEGGDVSSQLGLQQLPCYIVYSAGQEVVRLSSSPDRRRLAEVVAQQVAACGKQTDAASAPASE